MTDLGTLDSAWKNSQSYANSINDNGQIVGYSSLLINNNSQTHAFLYQNGSMTDLGTLPGGSYSYAVAIADNGVIIGYSNTGSGQDHAVLWQPSVVPEPVSSILFVTGGILLAGRRYLRKA